MPGTKKGGLAAAATNKVKYGEDFYKNIGAKGGKLGRTGGFYANRELAKVAGSKGSKNLWNKTKEEHSKHAQKIAESRRRNRVSQ